MTVNFLTEAESLFEYLQQSRRDFHMHPELGFQEVRTASIVTRELRKLGLIVTPGIAETGVTAIIDSGKPGKVCLMRFDMDALPIHEETGVDYTSITAGVMHACGHDAHVAIGLATAKLLAENLNTFSGMVKLVFQPAEEGLGGAKKMIEEGVLKNPKPDFALGIHVWNEAPLGWIGISSGSVMAASEIFRVVIRGRGGHGALPSNAIDPVVAAAEIISALQTIVSRNVHPQKTAVVSVTAIRGGQAFNVIPQDVEIKGTIRTFDPSVREMVLTSFTRIVNGVANSLGCSVEIELQSLTPALVNDAWVTGIVQQTALKLWHDAPLDTHFATMGSEDMAFFLNDIPGCFIFMGSANQHLGLSFPHHHPKFDIDEKVLPMAAGLITSAAVALLTN